MSRWLQTFTGRKIHPLAAQPSEIHLDDIGHALSLRCRFGGHCRDFYSVAQHSVHVSEVVASEGGSMAAQAAALFHDAPEAYGPDFCQPVKDAYHVFVERPQLSCCDSISVGAAEDELLRVIHTALDIPQIDQIPDYNLVKRADRILLLTEQRDLMGPSPEPWTLTAPYLWNTITPLPPPEARTLFLRRAARLLKSLKVA